MVRDGGGGNSSSSWLGPCWDLDDLVLSTLHHPPAVTSTAAVHPPPSPRSRRDPFRQHAGPSRQHLHSTRLIALIHRLHPPPSPSPPPPADHHTHLWPLHFVHPPPPPHPIPWLTLPAAADPARGGPGAYKPSPSSSSASTSLHSTSHRAARKQHQVASIAALLASLRLPPASVIADLGCGSGALTLPLAATFPGLQFLGVDYKPRSVALLLRRATAAGLGNVRAWCGRIEAVREPFAAAVALHACGAATDLAVAQALARGAAYVVSPCCVGKCTMGGGGGAGGVEYPRSGWMRGCGVSRAEFGALARAADWSREEDDEAAAAAGEGDGKEEGGGRIHVVCKVLVEMDRQQAAREQGYRTRICALPGAGVVGIGHVLLGEPAGPGWDLGLDGSPGVEA